MALHIQKSQSVVLPVAEKRCLQFSCELLVAGSWAWGCVVACWEPTGFTDVVRRRQSYCRHYNWCLCVWTGRRQTATSDERCVWSAEM